MLHTTSVRNDLLIYSIIQFMFPPSRTNLRKTALVLRLGNKKNNSCTAKNRKQIKFRVKLKYQVSIFNSNTSKNILSTTCGFFFMINEKKKINDQNIKKYIYNVYCRQVWMLNLSRRIQMLENCYLISKSLNQCSLT